MNNKLTKSEQKQLIAALDEVAQHGGLNYWQSQGFLTHIHCYPNSLDPSNWASAIAAAKPSKTHWPFEQADMDLLFVLYNQLHEQMHGKSQFLPTALEESITLFEQRQLTQPFRNWCAGFVFGFRFLKEEWQKTLDEDVYQELDDCVAIIGYIATLGSDEAHAVAWRKGEDPKPSDLLATLEEALLRVWQLRVKH